MYPVSLQLPEFYKQYDKKTFWCCFLWTQCNSLLFNCRVILGAFIGGLLTSGDLFLWHKDTDTLKFVTGLPDFTEQPSTTSGKTNSNRTDGLFVPRVGCGLCDRISTVGVKKVAPITFFDFFTPGEPV